MADRHGKKELGIFERFARAAGLRVEPGTVEKRPPPEPDILCSVVGGARIAFELVEIIDRDFAERVYGQLRLKSLFERDAESRAQNAPIRSALANALVYVTFQEASFDSKRAAIPDVLAFLGGLSPLFQG